MGFLCYFLVSFASYIGTGVFELLAFTVSAAGLGAATAIVHSSTLRRHEPSTITKTF